MRSLFGKILYNVGKRSIYAGIFVQGGGVTGAGQGTYAVCTRRKKYDFLEEKYDFHPKDWSAGNFLL